VQRSKSYVVAFAGARDAYQVPLALENDGRLAKLVTDLYVPPSLARLAKRVGHVGRLERATHRSAPGLPSFKVRQVLPLAREILVPPRGETDEAALARCISGQRLLSERAAATAKELSADLFLYAGYAEQAFSDPALARARKVLFMYHPHVRPSAAILKEDFKRFPEARSSEAHIDRDLRDEINDRELGRADLVVCASSFTARSVCDAGFAAASLKIIPYGIDLGDQASVSRRTNTRCRFLFVGSGVHRKGLHLLVDAWKKAELPDADLTLICRNIEPWIEARVRDARIELVRGVSGKELDRIYADSDVFVLPSLIEGFGYVYLEALSKGCFCIGTHNTGLPDLQLGESEGVALPAGDLEALVEALRSTHGRWKGGGLDAPVIAAAASRWPWERFRKGVADAAS